MGRLRAEVSHDHCVGVAMCVQHKGAGFKLNEAGLSEFRPHGELDENALQRAADACPMGAITITTSQD